MVDGYELPYPQPLSFLPGWASNFGVLANITPVKSSASFATTGREILIALRVNF
ncbi:hypothetical protein GNX18_11920 [Microbulbifer sp. SH-1]|uniref:hypothetical protein n=1 Tax=Microbulbifer sp. SH-1 TaxID=2681547 RepID=UPI0014093F15|nr:hypothetical protein [Microbulbifer sp. SH-1]QIL90384.1 hypothetical protein GNX18_11920 [Microbulbifer sp. SH-1]